jgi:hypothetical protein
MIMKKKNFLALMLTAAVAGAAVIACSNDDKNTDNDSKKAETPIAGDYSVGTDSLRAYIGGAQAAAIPGVNWSIEALTNDTISVTTDTISILGVNLFIKAYGKQDAADSTLYGAIVPVQNLPTNVGAITLNTGKVSYRPATKTSAISAEGTIYTAIGQDSMGNMPFSVTLKGAKK